MQHLSVIPTRCKFPPSNQNNNIRIDPESSQEAKKHQEWPTLIQRIPCRGRKAQIPVALLDWKALCFGSGSGAGPPRGRFPPIVFHVQAEGDRRISPGTSPVQQSQDGVLSMEVKGAHYPLT